MSVLARLFRRLAETLHLFEAKRLVGEARALPRVKPYLGIVFLASYGVFSVRTQARTCHSCEKLRKLSLMKAGIRFLASTLLLLALAMGGCQSPEKKKKTTKQETKPAKVKPGQESTDVDFDGFVSRLRKAVAAHDMNTIAQMMTPNFGYQLEPPLEGDGVFKYWDENNLWPELEGILSEKFVKSRDKDFMVAPPQFADPSLNYDGYRAGIRRVNGSWKFAYFVNG